MAVAIQGKLNELNSCQKTDGSIQAEYNQISREHQQTKSTYKLSRSEYKLAQEQLEQAQENFRQAPLTKMFSADRQVKMPKKNLKQKKLRIQTDREAYKQKLKELRRLKSEIRSQYKSHREYAKFFRNVQEAQKMGIVLPKYITDEYTKQKGMYLSEKYTVNKNGGRTYITPPNTICSKDVSTLIMEKKHQNAREKIQNVVTKAKDHFIQNDDGR